MDGLFPSRDSHFVDDVIFWLRDDIDGGLMMDDPGLSRRILVLIAEVERLRLVTTKRGHDV